MLKIDFILNTGRAQEIFIQFSLLLSKIIKIHIKFNINESNITN